MHSDKTRRWREELCENRPPKALVSPHKRCQESRAGFFACYLLTSLCPRYKGRTYIGYTVNPRRRIRQHNGEIGSGASRTKMKRPWEMVLCIYGFPTNIAALQFEWAWQHPLESFAVRKAAASFKSLSGLGNKIKLAYTMLTLPPWQSLNLTMNLFSTKYQKHTHGCPTLPEQMQTQASLMDELPCYNDDDDDDKELDRHCTFQESSTEEEPAEATRGHFKENVPQHDVKEDQGQQSFIMNGSPRMPISLSSSDIVDNREKSPWLVEEVTLESNQQLPARPSVSSIASGGDQSRRGIVTPEVEVIEIFTPSPKGNSCTRKRTLIQCPEIIDLTNSPV